MPAGSQVPERRLFRKSFLLFVSSALVAAFLVLPDGPVSYMRAGLIFSVPASAAACLALLGDAFKPLFPDARRALPSVITLPAVYAALVVLLATMGTTSEFGIAQIPEAFDAVGAWLSLRVVGLAALAQATVLGLDAWWLRRRSGRSSDNR
jgi:hypothetical protein